MLSLGRASTICILALTLAVHIVHASIDPRITERAWAQYVPTLHRQFVQQLDLDWMTREELREAQRARLSVRIFLNSTGKITRAELEHESALPRFNAACLRAAHAIPQLRNLTPSLLEQGERKGLVFHFGL